MITKQLNKIRIRRAVRSRAKIYGTAERPRLSVFRSNKYIYAQLIDDEAKKTLVEASSVKSKVNSKANKSSQSESVGAEIAKKASEKGIKSAIFDRGGYRYHGRVKALCEAARKGGLQI